MSDNVFQLANAAIRAAHAEPPMPHAADAVFRAMHGFYGQLWLSKFATGQAGADGSDTGVVSAKAIWAHGLRDFDSGVVKLALRQCLERHPDFPPSLPQFVALCRANAPREVFKALPMSAELYAERSKEAREKLRELRQRIQPVARATGGLALLFEAIADAVKCAGGDEIAALRRLDGMLAARGGA